MQTEAPASPTAEATEVAPTEEATEEAPAVELTTAQQQAIGSAESYIAYSAFSRAGLIHQLEYEKFSKEQAKAGVAAIDVDWNEQAALKAEEYLDSMNFSKKELIAQLKYEGFTAEQAKYGVSQAGF